MDDIDKFRYDSKDNRRLQSVAVSRVFKKSGRYIFQLGIVNFLEQIIINLFLVIHCYYREQEIFKDAQESLLLQKKYEYPFLLTHVSRDLSTADICSCNSLILRACRNM